MITIPTLTTIYADVKADIEAEMDVTIPVLGKYFLRAIAAVQAGKVYLLYLYAGAIQKNIFVDTADPVSGGGTLERFGEVKLDRSRNPAVAAVYTATVTGSTSATIKASTTFKADDSSLNAGALFIIDAAYTMPGVTGVITIRALESGLDSKLNIGDTLTTTSPILNIDSVVTIATETTAPVAAETVEEYRSKILESYRLEAQGGASSDYKLWAADVTGIRTVYPYASTGASGESNISVYAEASDGTAPSSSKLAELGDVFEQDPDTTKDINERGRRPLGVLNVTTAAITTQSVVVTITGLLDDSATVKTAIDSALEDYLFTVRPYISGADEAPKRNDTLTASNLALSIQNAIGTANYFTSVAFEVGGNSVASYNFTNGEIPVKGTTAYV